ncbi:MAG TPA: 50S ribosomal protein L35 [candidate division Zixibacteria bacterium]|nr:50S ribosomal protein L35 [candidate division Zixibacteria bacterium]
MAKKQKKYKLKTYKAAAKRFRMTKTGKIMRMQGGKSHLRRKKSKRVLYKIRKNVEVTARGDKKKIMRLAPYLKKYKANPPK